MDEGVTAVAPPVPADRVTTDRESAVELVHRLELNGERPSSLRVEGNPPLARKNMAVFATT
jgi:hypothetical protein